MINIPRLNMAHLPTPVDSMPRLGAYLGGYEVQVKRDDQTGLAFGGNKTRKLETLVAAAQANGARTLITTGAIQSNHCRQTAAAAARAGLDAMLVLTGEQPPEQSANLLLDGLLGAEIIWADRDQREQQLQEVFNTAWNTGRRPYLIPYGGSNATGAAAYTSAIKEVMNQGVEVDWIIFASSSGGTQAGMVAGAYLYDFRGKILGISVDEPADRLQARIATLASEVCDLLGSPHHFEKTEILVNDAYLGGGYGVLGSAEEEAIRLVARLEGLLLDPVYTGRAAAGMIDLFRAGFFKPGEKVLFWHTGGTPALFATQYQDRLRSPYIT